MNRYTVFNMLMTYYEAEGAVLPLEDIKETVADEEMLRGMHLFAEYLHGKYRAARGKVG